MNSYKKIKTDSEALEYIEKLLNCDYHTQEEGDLYIYILNEYCNDISDLIFYSDDELTPEEILKLAHEKNKPILL